MKIEVYKETDENWFGNYEIDDKKLVKVMFTQTGPFPPDNGEWRVCVWGTDDFGMEKDFIDHDEAMKCFQTVIQFDKIKQMELIRLGFKIA